MRIYILSNYHLVFCEMASLYALRSSSNSTCCRSAYDDNGESRLIKDKAGTTWRGTSFLTFCTPLKPIKSILKTKTGKLSCQPQMIKHGLPDR